LTRRQTSGKKPSIVENFDISIGLITLNIKYNKTESYEEKSVFVGSSVPVLYVFFFSHHYVTFILKLSGNEKRHDNS
jgi:hypothetical protein